MAGSPVGVPLKVRNSSMHLDGSHRCCIVSSFCLLSDSRKSNLQSLLHESCIHPRIGPCNQPPISSRQAALCQLYDQAYNQTRHQPFQRYSEPCFLILTVSPCRSLQRPYSESENLRAAPAEARRRTGEPLRRLPPRPLRRAAGEKGPKTTP